MQNGIRDSKRISSGKKVSSGTPNGLVVAHFVVSSERLPYTFIYTMCNAVN